MSEMIHTQAAESGKGTAPAASKSHRERRRTALFGRLARLFPQPATRGECRCRNPYGEVGEGTEVLLDVRDLPMDGQIGRTLERMEELPAGMRLRHVNSRIVWPMLAMLETRGYRYRLVGRREDAVHILIWGATPAR